MKIISRYWFICLFVLLIGCSSDDETESVRDFYAGVLKSANPELLYGTWAIFEASYEGQTFQIPASYEDCGRDFMQFVQDGTLREYIYNYDCLTNTNTLSWSLDEGIITLSNDFLQSNEMVITQLTDSKLVFKTLFDIDEDGVRDPISFLARRYSPPNDIDIYSYTFNNEGAYSYEHEIKFVWQKYDGFYGFDRYEIYRSINCTKTGAELVAVINDVNQTTFSDFEPPVQDEICYYFRLYNSNGLVAESVLNYIDTSYLRPKTIVFSSVEVLNNSVNLSWLAYDGNYFGKYIITTRNYESGYGQGYQEKEVITIADINTTNYVDTSPPMVKDPIYAIYVEDIFGNRRDVAQGDNIKVIEWDRPEVLPFESTYQIVADNASSSVYVYGNTSNYEDPSILKFNYEENRIEATSNRSPLYNPQTPMKLLETPIGKELFFLQTNQLLVYDAFDIKFKYALDLPELSNLKDYAYLGNNKWAFVTDNEFILALRDNANLELLDKQAHFNQSDYYDRFKLIRLNDNSLLIGHNNSAQSYKFNIDSSGLIIDKSLVNISLKFNQFQDIFYSPNKQIIVSSVDNRIYSTINYEYITSYEQPYFATSLGLTSGLIYGTNNNPDFYSQSEIHQEKKIRIFNSDSRQVNTLQSEGYPLYIFENHRGQVISISSEFERRSISYLTPKRDMYFEVIR